MTLDQDSDPPLVFPDSPTPVAKDLDDLFSGDPHTMEAEQRGVSSTENGVAKLGEQYPILEAQEVEAESDTDPSLRAEARAQRVKSKVLKIKLRKPKLSSSTKRGKKGSSAKRKTESFSESESENKPSDSTQNRIKKKKRHSNNDTLAKNASNLTNTTIPDSTDDQLPIITPASDMTQNKLRVAVTILSDDELVSEDEETVMPPKRGRGRPRGSAKVKVIPPTVEPVQRLDASVYVNLGVPPKLIRGRTHKGDKLEPQKPKQHGPFTLTANMSWNRFLEEVSETVEVELENLDITEMTWSFQKKTQLMLTNMSGYNAMIQQILALKDPSTAIIIVSLPVPKRVRKGSSKHEQESDEESEEPRLDEDTKWGKKVALDDQLAPIVRDLEDRYPPGSCDEHLDISCFHYRPKNWHFHLDQNRTKVWANAILRKITDSTRPPLGQNFFLPKDRIGFSTRVTTTTSIANPTTPGPSPAWPNFYPGFPSPGMMGFAIPPMHWGYPQTPTGPGYPQMPPPYKFPATPTPQGQLAPYYGTPTPQSHPYPSYGMSAPQPDFKGPQTGSIHAASVTPGTSEADVHEWCACHNLGDAECRGLIKLGFIVGETASLATLPMDMWEWAGLGPLHRQRILAACAA